MRWYWWLLLAHLAICYSLAIRDVVEVAREPGATFELDDALALALAFIMSPFWIPCVLIVVTARVLREHARERRRP